MSFLVPLMYYRNVILYSEL